MSLFEGLRSGAREVRGASRGTRDRLPESASVVVVGGGVAGVAAACVLAERGVRVVLLERGLHLGGRASAWTEHLADGSPFEMAYGLHGIVGHYYNFRALLRRVDPQLERLRPVESAIGVRDGRRENIAGLPRTAPLNLMALLRQTDRVQLRDLRGLDMSSARQLLRFDPVRTYAELSHLTAKEFLDGLRFPERGRGLIYDMLGPSFFHDPKAFCAAELLMWFHFHFLANAEGMSFDAFSEPWSDALWKPMERYLRGLDVQVELGCEVEAVEQTRAGWRVTHPRGACEAQGLVLATSVPGLQRIFRSSKDLREDAEFAESVLALPIAPAVGVWRSFLERAVVTDRPSCFRTSGEPRVDQVALYSAIEGESRRWSLRTGGTVVQVRGRLSGKGDGKKVPRAFRATLDAFMPELRGARVAHASWAINREEPAFPPGSHGRRPRVSTPYGNVALAGDYVKLPFPAVQLERACATGLLAANRLLDAWDVRGERVFSVAPRGVIAGLPLV